MEFSWAAIAIVCPLVFLAGFVDSVAGGGGLISIPAYIFAGIPVINAYGTNHFSMCLGTCVSSFKFFKTGNVHLKTALYSGVSAVIGAWLGARLAMILDERILKYFLMIILPCAAVFILFNRKFGSNSDTHEKVKHLYLKASIIGLIMGGYDGFFGPGTGTFLIIAFCMVLGLPIVTASGNAKLTNLASSVAAAVTFVFAGKVLYWLAIPAAFCTISGNYIGAKLAIKNGEKIIRPIIIVVIVLLLGKIIYEMF